MLLALSMASFALVHVIPGDPALVMMGGEGTTQAVEELRRQLGLDRPLHVRYLEWLGRIAQGDLGTVPLQSRRRCRRSCSGGCRRPSPW